MIKAIETIWNGIKFRSRTEARWAAFLEKLHIEYQYEMEGFHLPNGEMYVPDFWLPEYKCWIEIKGTKEGHSQHVDKLMRVCEADVGQYGFVFVGQPLEMVGSFVGVDFTDSSGGTYGGTFDAGIAYASKHHSLVLCVNSGRSIREYRSACDYELIDHIWNDSHKKYWHDSGVFDAALEVSKIRFWK